MERRAFLRQSCSACLSVSVLSTLVNSCTPAKYLNGRISENGLIISKDDFIIKQNGGTSYNSFIIVRNPSLNYPICIYRENENQYTALWMKCSHQGAELRASGDVLECPAHGSEFNNKGEVRNGPASENLRTFPVSVSGNDLFIDLRKKA